MQGYDDQFLLFCFVFECDVLLGNEYDQDSCTHSSSSYFAGYESTTQLNQKSKILPFNVIVQYFSIEILLRNLWESSQ